MTEVKLFCDLLVQQTTDLKKEAAKSQPDTEVGMYNRLWCRPNNYIAVKAIGGGPSRNFEVSLILKKILR